MLTPLLDQIQTFENISTAEDPLGQTSKKGYYVFVFFFFRRGSESNFETPSGFLGLVIWSYCQNPNLNTTQHNGWV